LTSPPATGRSLGKAHRTRVLNVSVPEEFTEVGKAMAEHLAARQRTVSRLGGGKAVDYAEIEQAMAERAGRTELAGHRAILQSPGH
jgi:hypothetical protein